MLLMNQIQHHLNAIDTVLEEFGGQVVQALSEHYGSPWTFTLKKCYLSSHRNSPIVEIQAVSDRHSVCIRTTQSVSVKSCLNELKTQMVFIV